MTIDLCRDSDVLQEAVRIDRPVLISSLSLIHQCVSSSVLASPQRKRQRKPLRPRYAKRFLEGAQLGLILPLKLKTPESGALPLSVVCGLSAKARANLQCSGSHRVQPTILWHCCKDSQNHKGHSQLRTWCQVGSFTTFDFSGRGDCGPVTGLHRTNTSRLVGRKITEKSGRAVDTGGKVTRRKVNMT